MAHLVLNRARNFYDFATWGYLLTLFAAFGLFAIYSLRVKAGAAPDMAQFTRRSSYVVLAAFLLFGNVANMAVLGRTYYLPLARGWTGVYTPILHKNAEDEDRRVQVLLPSCGPVDADSRLIVDDRVYPYVESHPKPVPITWLWTIFGMEMGGNLSDEARASENWRRIIEFMKAQKITTAVGLCPSFNTQYPPGLIKELGDRDWSQSFCCLRVPQ